MRKQELMRDPGYKMHNTKLLHSVTPPSAHPVIHASLAVIGSAVMLTLAFPKTAWWPLGFTGLAPILFVLLDDQMQWNWRRVFMVGYGCGCVWFTASLWWIGYVTIAGMLVLAQLLAFFMGVGLVLGWWLAKRGWPAWLAYTAAWLVYETIQTYFLTGFPWLLLGYAMQPVLTLIQCAELLGVYGVSALVVLVNVAVAECALLLVGKRNWNEVRGSMAVASLLVIAATVFGVWRIRMLDVPAEKTVRVALIQGNIPSLVKHDRTRDYDILQRHVLLTRMAMRENPDVIIWPESAVPGYFFERRLAYHTITQLVGEVRRPLIAGLARYEWSDEGDQVYYNSAVVVEPNGLVSSVYDKQHLVMFGEYVPFERYLPFLKLVTPIDGSFTAGQEARALVCRVGEEGTVRFKPLICFEDVIGELARISASEPEDVLLNLTNDGWFRSSPGPYQHAALSVFRAVEQRRPLVRCTNSGVTMVVDHIGRTRAVLQRGGRKTEIEGTLVYDVPLHKTGRTTYAHVGNLLLWVTCGGAGVGICRAAAKCSE